jgi:hypothetical protein
LWLLGKDEIKLNVRELDGSFTRTDIQTVFGDINWKCAEQDTPFGNKLCATEIGTFNGYPSQVLTFYFLDDNISALKLIYRDQYHEQLLGYFIKQLGQPDNVEAALSEGPDAATVLEWDLDQSVLLMKKALGKGDEPSLVWLARKPQG